MPNSIEITPADRMAEFVRSADPNQTARILFDSLHTSAAASIQHNNKDSQLDTAAVLGDKTGLALAQKTGQDMDSLKYYIDQGGNFSDAQGQKLGRQVVGDLRQEHGEHLSDRQSDLQYAGRNGADPKVVASALQESNTMDNAIQALANPNLSQNDRVKDLKEVGASAQSLVDTAAHAGPQAGKDLKDIAFDSKIIQTEVGILMTGEISPNEYKALNADLNSRSMLVRNEIFDMGNESSYASHDSQAITAGGNTEAVINSAMTSHSSKAMQELGQMLAGQHNQSGTGMLDLVAKDRQQDMRLEPAYVQANNASNTLAEQFLELTDPYAAVTKKNK